MLAFAALNLTAQAVTIDFGTSWPVFTAPGVGNYATAPYNRVMGTEGGTHSNETVIATYLNTVAGTTFVAADIHKTNSPTELGGSNGYFTVPAGWNYLVAQYNGPNGGSVVINLGGNDAKVPFDSSVIWGTGDQYAVSHWSVAGPTARVPDGGMTLALLGISLASLAGSTYVRRRAA